MDAPQRYVSRHLWVAFFYACSENNSVPCSAPLLYSISRKLRTTHAFIAASESVSARYYATGSTSTTNATPTIINFDGKTKDSHGSVTTGASWKFTSQSPGEFLISTCVGFAVNSTGQRLIQIYKNGSFVANLGKTTTASGSFEEIVTGMTKVSLLAGDYIDVRAYQTSGGNLNVGVDQYTTYVDITRVGNY